MRNRWLNKPRAFGLSTVLLVLAFILACGSSATSTPQPVATSAPAPTTAPAPVATTAPAATAAPGAPSPTRVLALPTAAPTPTALPAPAKVELINDTINVGVQALGPIVGVGDPKELGANNGIARANVTFYESLLVSAANGDLIPRLLESWDTSDDGLVWTFNIKKGIPFHKGFGELVADDVSWSMRRAAEEGSKFGRAAPLRRVVGAPNVVEVIDDYTLTITTETVQFDALFSLRTPYGAGLAIASQAAFDNGLADSPIGTGPWQFVEARTDEFWEMEVVEDHWRQTPFFRGLKLWIIPEESTRVAAYQAGDLDTGEVAFANLEALAAVPGMKFNVFEAGGQFSLHLQGNFYSVDRPGYNPEFAWVSTNKDVNSDEWAKARDVRLAMALAIDRDLIVETLLNGQALPYYYFGSAGNSTLKPLIDENPTPFKYDPDRARQLLAGAGYSDGFNMPLACFPRGLPSDDEVCEAVAGMWQTELGISTDISRIPYTSFRPRIFDRDFDRIWGYGLGTYPEPMALYPNSTYVDAGWNAGFEHPILDDLIRKAQVTVDPVKRQAITLDIARFQTDNVTHIPIYAPNIIYPVGPKIDTWPLQGGDTRLIHNFEFIPPRQ